MENFAIKGRGGNDVQHKNWKGKILRIWIKETNIYTSGSGSKEVPGGLGPASFLGQEKLFSQQGLSPILWSTYSKIRIGHANWQGFNRETSLSYT